MTITLYDIAQRFVGMREVEGKVSNPAILAMLQLDNDWPKDDEVAWCSAALNYWAWLLRLPRSKSLMAKSWLGVGRPVHLVDARAGFDVAVLWRGERDGTAGHVALFAGLDRTDILLLGGNQGNSVNVSPFPQERILGIRRLLEE